MTDYKQLLIEINEIVGKIIAFENQILDNKARIEDSISVTKQHIADQTTQYNQIRTEFESGLESIDQKFVKLLDDVRNKVDQELKNTINEKLELLKNVLSPLEIEIGNSNNEVMGIKDFFKSTLKVEMDKSIKEITELKSRFSEQEKNLAKLEKITKILDDARQSDETLLMNLKNMQLESKQRDENLNRKLDKLLETQ